MSKLETLAEHWGQSVDDLLHEAVFDGSCAGICKTKGCDYSTEVEPDQGKGWCEECEKGTVVSCLMLAGVM